MKSQYIFGAVLSAFVMHTANAANFTIGVEGTDYMPISKGDAGGYSGYARELLDAFAAKAGHTFVYKPMPVARLIDEFATQKALDFKFPDNAYWAGDAKKGLNVVYSKGLVSVTEGLMVLPANKGKGAASVTKIATLRGFTPFPYLDSIKAKKIAVTEVNAADAAISMGEAGRVDGVYLGVIAANYILTEVVKKPGALVYDASLPNSTNDFSMSTLAHPEVIRQLDEFLVKEKDTVSRIKAKYKIVE